MEPSSPPSSHPAQARPFDRETFDRLGKRFKEELTDLLQTQKGDWALLTDNAPNEYYQSQMTAYQRGLGLNQTFFIGKVEDEESRTFFFTRAHEYFRF